MLKIVSDSSNLQKYQSQFMKQLQDARTGTVHCSISWRPASRETDVNWSSTLKLWWYTRDESNRWWNVFGINQPKPLEPMRITCEINIPMRGINRNIAGAFAEDENNRVLVVHRGNRWGGGRAGITKELFWTNYSGHSEASYDRDRVTKVAVIAELGNPKLPSDIANFVHWVARTKASV